MAHRGPFESREDRTHPFAVVVGATIFTLAMLGLAVGMCIPLLARLDGLRVAGLVAGILTFAALTAIGLEKLWARVER